MDPHNDFDKHDRAPYDIAPATNMVTEANFMAAEGRETPASAAIERAERYLRDEGYDAPYAGETENEAVIRGLLAALKGEAVIAAPPAPPALAELRATFTNEVIRAIGALARQQNVCREQAGQVVFVTGMEAAREYIMEHFQAALLAVSVPPTEPK